MKSLSAGGGLVPLLEPQPTAPQRGRQALFRLGFRPFYLLAALWAALAVPLWIAQFAGLMPPPMAYPAMLWHAHEMTFGFALAVIVGFLLAFAATMISNPVTFPLLVAAELKVGETLLGNAPVSLEKLMAGEGWWDAIWQLAVGTTVLSLTVGLLGASMAWGTTVAWRRWKRQKLHG